MDAVWWIDLLPPKEDFRERVGLNTYLLHGTNKVAAARIGGLVTGWVGE